ncbi:MAG: hypothetical protein U0414_30625 [Polyangiaceae bacterium]
MKKILLVACVTAPLACYTYNFYDDGQGGANAHSTSTGSTGSTNSGGSSGSTSSASTTTSSTSTTATGPFLMCDSTGLGDPMVTGLGCPLPGAGVVVDSMAAFDGSCRLAHPNDQGFPVLLGGELVLRSACSEWSPYGYGPAVFRRADATGHDLMMFARFEFPADPEVEFHGAGLFVRAQPETPPASTQSYVLLDVYNHAGGVSGVPAVGVWGNDGTAPMNPFVYSTGANAYSGTSLAICYQPATSTAFTFAKQSGAADWTFLAKPVLNLGTQVELGAGLHAKSGGAYLEAHVVGLTITQVSAGSCTESMP